MKASTAVLFSFALAATPAFALYNNWNGNAGNSVFNDGRNWGGTPDFSRAACVSGAQSQIGAMKSGTYTLTADAYVNRFVIDQANTTVNFEFGDYTAYFIGIDGVAFGATKNGSGSQYYVKSGTLCVPNSFKTNNVEAITDARSLLGLPRGSDVGNERPLHDAVIMADGDLTAGTFGTIDARVVQLQHGTNNCIGARNGGVFKANKVTFQASNASSVSNRLTIANGGVWKGYSDTVARLTLTFGGTANGHRVEFLDGGKIEGFNGFGLAGGSGFRTVFSGEETQIEMEANGDVSYLNGAGNSFEVLNGAHVKLTNSEGKNKARFWLGTNDTTPDKDNFILVDGEGSQLELTASGTLLGQNLGQHNGLIVTNKGKAIINCLHIGQGVQKLATYSADRNYLRVVDGGEFIDTSTTYVGYGGGYSHFNRMEVLSNAVVSNQALQVGRFHYSHSNELVVADGGKLQVKGAFFVGNENNSSASSCGNHVLIGVNGRCEVGGSLDIGSLDTSKSANVTVGNVFEVLTNGVVEVGGRFYDYGSNTTIRLAGGRIHAKSGIQIPWYNASNYGTVLEISGPSPLLRGDQDITYDDATSSGGYAFAFRHSAIVRFKPPKEGWSEPPLQAPYGELGIFGGTQLEFDLSEFLAANGGVGGKLVLADAEECNYDAQVIAKSNAALQAKYPKCKLVVEGTKLVLKTPSGLGLLLIFR